MRKIAIHTAAFGIVIVNIAVISLLWAIKPTSVFAQAKEPTTRNDVPTKVETGRVSVAFQKSSPLSTAETLLSRLEISEKALPADIGADKAKWIPDFTGQSFDVYVPASYKPNTPFGLFIWTGVSDMRPDWEGVISRHQLIVVDANIRKRDGQFLGADAWCLDAVDNLKSVYNIDDKRIYLSGFSAGGSFAAGMTRAFPDVFSGGLFLMGGVFHTNYSQNWGNSGPWQATVLSGRPNWKGPLEKNKKDLKLVEMRGGADTEWIAQEGRVDCDGLVLDGFERVTYLEVPSWTHQPPTQQWFERGIAALEASPKAPPITSPTKDANPQPSQFAQAQRLVASARRFVEEESHMSEQTRKRMSADWRKRQKAEATKYLQQAIDDYPTTPAAKQARDLLDKLEPAPANSSPP